MKTFILALLMVFSGIPLTAQLSAPGSFARLGFGARGMGQGNALTAQVSGDINTYYNPALAAYANSRNAAVTFGALSLDRSLNFISYTQPIEPKGGFSFGIINAGVKNIDGRDGDGEHTEDYSTFENQFYLAFANRVADELSIGVAVKMYYSKLFDNITSSSVGFDIGAVYQPIPALSFGLALIDINSKYNWDTGPVYGQDGKQSKESFPMLRRLGVAFDPSLYGLKLSAEYENTSTSMNTFRVGVEDAIHENITVRGGVDRIDFSDDATGAKPSFGFTVHNQFGDWTPALTYAFIFEPFASSNMHIITLSTTF